MRSIALQKLLLAYGSLILQVQILGPTAATGKAPR